METAEDHAGLAGLRILMVEDEMMLAMSLEDLLKLVGCDVVKAPSVKKALALLENEQLDGALSCSPLPSGEGLGVRVRPRVVLLAISNLIRPCGEKQEQRVAPFSRGRREQHSN